MVEPLGLLVTDDLLIIFPIMFWWRIICLNRWVYWWRRILELKILYLRFIIDWYLFVPVNYFDSLV